MRDLVAEPRPAPRPTISVASRPARRRLDSAVSEARWAVLVTAVIFQCDD